MACQNSLILDHTKNEMKISHDISHWELNYCMSILDQNPDFGFSGEMETVFNSADFGENCLTQSWKQKKFWAKVAVLLLYVQ